VSQPRPGRKIVAQGANPGRRNPHSAIGTPLPRGREWGRGRGRVRKPTAGAVGYLLSPALRADFIVADALAARLKERDRQLAHACDVANRSRAARAVERDFDVLTDEIAGPWDEEAWEKPSLRRHLDLQSS
jgi:hypothetical protein